MIPWKRLSIAWNLQRIPGEAQMARRRERKRLKAMDRREAAREAERAAIDEAREEADEWFDLQLPNDYL